MIWKRKTLLEQQDKEQLFRVSGNQLEGVDPFSVGVLSNPLKNGAKPGKSGSSRLDSTENYRNQYKI